MSLPQLIADRLLQARQHLNLTQGQLAERADITQSLVSRLEACKVQDPGVAVLDQIARALGIPLAAFVDTSAAPFLHALDMPQSAAAPTGVFLGHGSRRGESVTLDRWSADNSNVLIAGTHSSGRQYVAKSMAAQELMISSQFAVIDPLGEYTKLIEQVGGQMVSMIGGAAPVSVMAVNPFDLMGAARDQHQHWLEHWLCALAEGDDMDRTLISGVLNALYDQVDTPPSWRSFMGTLARQCTAGGDEAYEALHTRLLTRFTTLAHPCWEAADNEQLLAALDSPQALCIDTDVPGLVEPASLFMLRALQARRRNTRSVVHVTPACVSGERWALVLALMMRESGGPALTIEVLDMAPLRHAPTIARRCAHTVLMRQNDHNLQLWGALKGLDGMDMYALGCFGTGDGWLLGPRGNEHFSVTSGGRLSSDAFDLVKQHVDLIDYLTEHGGVDLTEQSGDKFIGLCPFHTESTPSFFVYPESDGYRTFHCFGCNANGSVIDAVMEKEGYAQPLGAVMWLDDRYGLNLTDELDQPGES